MRASRPTGACARIDVDCGHAGRVTLPREITLRTKSRATNHGFPIPDNSEYLILRAPIVWYNSFVKQILPLLLLVCANRVRGCAGKWGGVTDYPAAFQAARRRDAAATSLSPARSAMIASEGGWIRVSGLPSARSAPTLLATWRRVGAVELALKTSDGYN